MRPLQIALGLVLAATIGAVLAPTPPQVASLVGLRRDAWQAPAVPLQSDAGLKLADIMAASYWGPAAKAAEVVEPVPELERWRISAVFRSASESGVWVEFSVPGKPAQRLNLGDKLPSGHRIVEIGEREVCVLVGKKKLRLGVERWNG